MAWMLPPGNMRSDHHMFLEDCFESSEENSKSKGRQRKKLLYKTVREQMEFYFSDANLSKDRYLRQLVEDDPFVPIEVFLRFNKINRLVSSVEEIAKAIKKSDILELSEDCCKVHRNAPLKMKDNEDDCTIYVENLPPEISHEELSKVFSQFGKVVYVSIPKYQNTRQIKGFAFVEFDTPKEADETIQIFKDKGSCLSPHMLPEKLCSIQTFDHQNQQDNHKSHIVKEEELKSNESNVEDSHLSTSIKNEPIDKNNCRKRKLDDPDSTEQLHKKEKGDGLTDGLETLKEKNLSDHKVTGETNAKQEIKKGETDVKQEIKREDDDANSCTESGQEGKSMEKKKKKRKKIKRPKELELFANGMVVLSKKEWKRLRNKYLNMQRVNMRRVKQQVLEARFMRRQPFLAPQLLDHGRDEEMRPPPPPVDAPKPRVTFVPGVIVCVKFNEPVVDVKAFKAEARTQTGVQYVDIHEGACEAFLRSSSSSDAQHLLHSKFWKNMSLLNGDAESEYWEKIFKDREAKLGNKVRVGKERGRKKLLRKAEIVKATHLHFEN